jgi:hypothetical protein
LSDVSLHQRSARLARRATSRRGLAALAGAALVALGAVSSTAGSADAATKAGLHIYPTFGAEQGAVRGPDGQIWLTAFDPPQWQGNPGGSQALDAVNPATGNVGYYGPLPPYLGSEKSPTLLAYANGAPAFDGSKNAWLIATATTFRGAQSSYLVRYTPGPSTSKIIAVPKTCAVPGGLTSAGDGTVWLRCATTTSSATPKLLRITSAGSVREFSLSGPVSIGAFAAGASGSMWAVGYNKARRATGLVRFTAAGKESFFASQKGYTAQGVAGNGSGRLVEIAGCGSQTCYLSVSTSGKYKRVAIEPGKAAAITDSYGPTMDPKGNLWTLNDGSVYKTGQYFLELTSANKVKAYPFTLPGGCGQLAITGSPAATSDGSVWVESASNCAPISITSNAFVGGIVRYVP